MEKDRLQNLLARVVRNDGAIAISMLEALNELDAFCAADSLDPQLHHYLSKRSYEKALVLVETGQSCGHHEGGK